MLVGTSAAPLYAAWGNSPTTCSRWAVTRTCSTRHGTTQNRGSVRGRPCRPGKSYGSLNRTGAVSVKGHFRSLGHAAMLSPQGWLRLTELRPRRSSAAVTPRSCMTVGVGRGTATVGYGSEFRRRAPKRPRSVQSNPGGSHPASRLPMLSVRARFNITPPPTKKPLISRAFMSRARERRRDGQRFDAQEGAAPEAILVPPTGFLFSASKRVSGTVLSAPGRIRTSDPRIRSPRQSIRGDPPRGSKTRIDTRLAADSASSTRIAPRCRFRTFGA